MAETPEQRLNWTFKSEGTLVESDESPTLTEGPRFGASFKIEASLNNLKRSDAEKLEANMLAGGEGLLGALKTMFDVPSATNTTTIGPA